MTNEQQIKALAELDGWTEVTNHRSELEYKQYRVVDETIWTSLGSQMPDYLNSYDAIIPLIQKQPNDVKEKTQDWLCGKQGLYLFVSVTPAQLCEALLRATGKWIES